MLGSRDDNKLSLGAAWLSFASLFQCEVSRVGRHLYLFSVFNRVKPPLPIITQTTKPSSCLLLLAPTPPFLFSSLQHLLPQRNLWEEKAFWVFQKPTSPCLTSVPRCSECCSETNASCVLNSHRHFSLFSIFWKLCKGMKHFETGGGFSSNCYRRRETLLRVFVPGQTRPVGKVQVPRNGIPLENGSLLFLLLQ